MRIGIDLGGTNIKIGLVDDAHQILRRASLPTGEDLSFAAVMDRVESGVRSLLRAGEAPERIGIGVPSTVLHNRIAVHTPNLNWFNCDVAEDMERRFSRPCGVGNDADCAALGESLAGAGRGCESMVMLTLGTGVGGSVVYGGKVLQGSGGCGVEPGHMKIVANGELCGCGARGCLEAYASATALKRELLRAVRAPEATVLKKWILEEGRKPSAKLAFDAADQGDPVGRRILDAYLHYLAIGVSNCVLLYRPQIVVLGGGISGAGEALFESVNAQVRRMTFCAEMIPCPEAVPAQLGSDAGIIGAAFL